MSSNDEEDKLIARIDFEKKIRESSARMEEKLTSMIAGLSPKEQEALRKRFEKNSEAVLLRRRAEKGPAR